MSKEIYLCNKIERLPIYSAEMNDNKDIVPKAGKIWLEIAESSGKFVEENKYTSGGILWVQKLNIDCELSNQEVTDIALVPHIYRLYFSDGSIGIYGSIKIPVVEPKITGLKNKKQISFERNSLVSEF